VIERIERLKTLEVAVRAGRATRRYKVVKSHRPVDLVFQSVAKGAPMRDNNILARHIKPAGRALKMEWVNWQVLGRSCAPGCNRPVSMSKTSWEDSVAGKYATRRLPTAGAGVAAEGGSEAHGVRRKWPNRRRCWLQLMSKCTHLQPSLKMAVCKLLKMVGRDGIEPPKPAFSGLLTDN
jgi:hypothetical protein